MSTKPTYYKVLWHNCNRCKTHYTSEHPHLKAYLCDNCWKTIPHFVVKTKKEKEMKPIDWTAWITLYTSMVLVVIAIIGYQLWLK